MLCLVTQSYLPLCHPMDCNPPGFSVQGVYQARILEWVACPPPGDLLNPGAEPRSPTLQADSLLITYLRTNKLPSFSIMTTAL